MTNHQLNVFWGNILIFLWDRSRTWRMAGREPWTGLCSSSLKLKFTIWTTDVNIGETWIPKSKKSAMIFEFKIEHEQLEYAGLVTQREFGNDRTSFVSQIIILAKGLKSIAQLFVEIQPLNKTKRNEYNAFLWYSTIV